MKAHELSTLFPAIHKDRLQELAYDIKKRGQLDNIVTLDGQILDGVQRQAACKLAGIKPRFITFESLNGEVKKAGPLAFVISANLHRRHLSTRERARIAAKLIPMMEDSRISGSNEPDVRNYGRPAKAAKLMNVSASSVKRAAKRDKVKLPKKAVSGQRRGKEKRDSGHPGASVLQEIGKMPGFISFAKSLETMPVQRRRQILLRLDAEFKRNVETFSRARKSIKERRAEQVLAEFGRDVTKALFDNSEIK